MVRHRSFAERHPVLLGLGILIWLGLVVAYCPLLVAAGTLTVVLNAVFLAARAEARRRDRARRRVAGHRRAVTACATVVGIVVEQGGLG